MIGKVFGFIRWIALIVLITGYAAQMLGYPPCTCGHLYRNHLLLRFQCTVAYCTCTKFKKAEE